MLIEKHISWIALNNVVGCPNNCSYCFLNGNKGVAPKVMCPSKDILPHLLKDKIYDPNTPIAVMINTDIFATSKNMDECFQVLEQAMKLHLNNLFVLVTKRVIPPVFAEKLGFLMQQGLKLLVYVSYSGLPPELEPGTQHDGMKDALITMKTLKEYKIPCAHYWRPLLPQNTTHEKLMEIYSVVKEYCIGSVITGLKLYPGMETPYWPEALNAYQHHPNCECIFPKGALEKLYSIVGDYPVFVDNFCLLALAQNIPCAYGIYNSIRCQKYNNCPYKKLSINPCSTVSKPLQMTCDENYWGNSLKSPEWIEI